MRYDETDLRVYASDVLQIAVKIEAALGRRRPAKGTWTGIEERLNDAANVLMKILTDLDGDQ